MPIGDQELPLPTDDTRAIAVRVKVHADQLDDEIAALREQVRGLESRIGALDAMVSALQKFVPRDAPSLY